jgi:hypothetical protein
MQNMTERVAAAPMALTRRSMLSPSSAAMTPSTSPKMIDFPRPISTSRISSELRMSARM